MGFIRCLADIFGVSKSIREETIGQVSNYMYQYGYWYNQCPKVRTVLQEYAIQISNNNHVSLIGLQHDAIRDKVINQVDSKES